MITETTSQTTLEERTALVAERTQLQAELDAIESPESETNVSIEQLQASIDEHTESIDTLRRQQRELREPATLRTASIRARLRRIAGRMEETAPREISSFISACRARDNHVRVYETHAPATASALEELDVAVREARKLFGEATPNITAALLALKPAGVVWQPNHDGVEVL